jgi:hypothetical protein
MGMRRPWALLGLPLLPADVRPEKFFSVVSGFCRVDDAGCFYSPNHPSDYPADMDCELSVDRDTTLVVVSFRTELRYDYLQINDNVRYSGTSGPSGVALAAGDLMDFQSDDSVEASGFKICDAASWCPAGSAIETDTTNDYLSGYPTTSACVACPRGTYAEAGGSIDCSACPKDTYTAKVGSTQCVACPSGTHSKRATGSSGCVGDDDTSTTSSFFFFMLSVFFLWTSCILLVYVFYSRCCSAKRDHVSRRVVPELARFRESGGEGGEGGSHGSEEGIAMVARPLTGYAATFLPLAVAVPVGVGGVAEAVVVASHSAAQAASTVPSYVATPVVPGAQEVFPRGENPYPARPRRSGQMTVEEVLERRRNRSQPPFGSSRTTVASRNVG